MTRMKDLKFGLAGGIVLAWPSGLGTWIRNLN